MTSLKKIEANRLNALKSTGPRTEKGKQRSRCNAIRHGLTAETVITALENVADYQAFETHIATDYQARTAGERELVSRLASVLWRLRRSTSIETGLFQVEAELMQSRSVSYRQPKGVLRPEWYDEFDTDGPAVDKSSIVPGSRGEHAKEDSDLSKARACCFVRVSRLQYGTFELLSRYETALWRQAAQLLFILQSAARR